MAEFNNYIGFTAVVDKVNKESVENATQAIQKYLNQKGFKLEIGSEDFNKILNSLSIGLKRIGETVTGEVLYDIDRIIGSAMTKGQKYAFAFRAEPKEAGEELLPSTFSEAYTKLTGVDKEIDKLIAKSEKLNEQIAKQIVAFKQAGGEIGEGGFASSTNEADIELTKLNKTLVEYSNTINQLKELGPPTTEFGADVDNLQLSQQELRNLIVLSADERQQEAEARQQELESFQTLSNLLDEKQRKTETINKLQFSPEKHEQEIKFEQEQLDKINEQIKAQKELNNITSERFTAQIETKEKDIAKVETKGQVQEKDIENVREIKKAYDEFNFALQEFQRLSSDARGFKARKMDTTAIEEAAKRYENVYKSQYEWLIKNAEASKELADATHKLEVVKNKEISQTTELIGKQKIGILGLGEAFWKSAKRVVYYTVTYRALRLVIQGLQDALKTTIEFDKIMNEIQMITGQTATQLKGLAKEYANIATQVGSTTQEVAEASKIWLQQGKSAVEAVELTKASMILSKVAMVEASDATEYLTAAMNAYGIKTSEVMTIVDKLAVIDMKAAVSTSQLAEALTRTAESADIAGIGLDKVLSYIATITETTRNATKAGEALKSIFARMGNIKLGKLVDDETSESLSDVETALGTIGISLRDGLTNFRNFGDVLDDVAAQWNDLTSVEQNYIATALAGKLCA